MWVESGEGGGAWGTSSRRGRGLSRRQGWGQRGGATTGGRGLICISFAGTDAALGHGLQQCPTATAPPAAPRAAAHGGGLRAGACCGAGGQWGGQGGVPLWVIWGHLRVPGWVMGVFEGITGDLGGASHGWLWGVGVWRGLGVPWLWAGVSMGGLGEVLWGIWGLCGSYPGGACGVVSGYGGFGGPFAVYGALGGVCGGLSLVMGSPVCLGDILRVVVGHLGGFWGGWLWGM